MAPLCLPAKLLRPLFCCLLFIFSSLGSAMDDTALHGARLLSASHYDSLCEVDLFDVFPGGPTYLLALKHLYPRDQYLRFDAAIMLSNNRESIPIFQQGGILEPPSNPRAFLRLQMAHGELCLNAIRCVGFLVAFNSLNGLDLLAPPSTQVHPAQGKKHGSSFWFQIPLEASGHNGLFNVDVRLCKGSAHGFVGVSAPLEGNDPIERVTIDLQGRPAQASLVRLAGITHLVVDGEANPFPGAEAAKPIVLKLAQTFASTHRGVFGVIWTKKLPNGSTRMDPVVCLTACPPEFFYEQSCGSGAAAVGIALAHAASIVGPYRFPLNPPSGMPIVTKGVRLKRPVRFKNIWVEGPVAFRGVHRNLKLGAQNLQR